MDKSENSCQMLPWGRRMDQIGSTGVYVTAVPVLPHAHRVPACLRHTRGNYRNQTDSLCLVRRLPEKGVFPFPTKALPQLNTLHTCIMC